jgi:DNA-binding response OmpR family regulator
MLDFGKRGSEKAVSKILVVDDDCVLAQSMEESLSAYGYIVDTANSAAEADGMIFVSSYDLIILDWQMPGMTGIDFLAKIRSKGIKIPVLMLTGMDTIDNKTTGLDTGADDYQTKPFNTRELLARVRALLRRPQELEGTAISAGGVSLDTRTLEVKCLGKDVKLTRQEFLLLEFFMRHQNQVFNSEALVERAWSTLSDSSPDTVRVHLSRLRKKLEEAGVSPIKTHHGQGYVFVP